MALFDTILTATDENATATLHALLRELQAKVTRATVRESLLHHPDFPSLLSLSDVLTDWKIDNTALQLNTIEQLRELPLPFIAHLHENGGWYVLVTALQGDAITYTDSTDGRKTELLTDFEKKWSGVILLAEADDNSGESDYATHRKQEILDELRAPFVWAGVLLLSLFVILSIAKDLTLSDWFLLLTKTIGLVLSGLLVAKQIGAKNTLTDRLCRISSKTNCDDVLISPTAKLWDWLSWTDIGLLYFAGSLLTVWSSVLLSDLRSLLYGIALLALPYTIFSVYYQGFVLRQWCPLCLGVQGILMLEGILAIIQIDSLPISWQPYMLTLSAFVLPTLAWVCVKPILVYLPKSRREHQELMRLKRDPDIFRALLMQQPQMPPVPASLHPVVLGNSEAEHIVTMVTNPYCGPCAQAHATLEHLITQNDHVKATIIFACDGEGGHSTQVAMQAMALSKQDNVAQALTDWYKQPEKDFTAWAAQYPIVLGLTDWIAIAAWQREWCLMANITTTPTLFVDGYQLPQQYQLSELRWLINGLEPICNESKMSV